MVSFRTVPDFAFPQDCVKTWGSCYYSGDARETTIGAYFRQEQVVVQERNGGTCSLQLQRCKCI